MRTWNFILRRRSIKVLSLSLSHTLTPTRTLYHSLSLSLTHSHLPTFSLSHTHTHTHSLSHTRSLSHTHTLSVKPLEIGFKEGLSVSNARRPVLRHKPGGGAYMAAVRGCNKDRPPPVYMLRPHNKHRACADQTLERVSVRERERERESAGSASEGLVSWRGSTRSTTKGSFPQDAGGNMSRFAPPKDALVVAPATELRAPTRTRLPYFQNPTDFVKHKSLCNDTRSWHSRIRIMEMLWTPFKVGPTP